MKNRRLLLFLTGLIFIILAVSACNNSAPTAAIPVLKETQASIERTQEAQVKTQQAFDVQKAVEETQAVFKLTEEAMALTLTAALPSETPTVEASETPIPTDTIETTETATPTETATATIAPTEGPCFKVLDSWCLTHEGCSTMDIINKTDSIAVIALHNKPKGTFDTRFTVAPGRCTMMLQPGRYHYYFEYCGKTSDGWHALNYNWYIQFTCP
jgi:hypothetical protein